MKDGGDETAGSDIGLHGHRPALQVICLGSGGGPSEENVTGMLVRSIASDWAKGSLLAVDAGSHLAPIIGILERDFPSVSGDISKPSDGHSGNGNGVTPVSRSLARASISPETRADADEPVKPEPTVLAKGPFAGLKFPNASARANALHVIRNYVSTYLITHPHLDHLSGFTINTAAFHATSRPKTLAALPSTVDAVKQHIFNDIIWPNLTDEDGGVGFVTFQRLKEGGDVMVGEGEGRGYIEVSDGLVVKAFKVSHGVCTKSPPSHTHRGSISGISDHQPPYNGSIVGEPAPGMARTASMSHHSQYSAPGTPGITPRQSFYTNQPSPRMTAVDNQSCVVDSTAFFIRDTETCREVLIFGDVEPDTISLNPRTHGVWKEAAHKIAHGLLGGIFIECSYDDSQADAFLFGHMNPRHLVAELQALAYLVANAKATLHHEKGVKKRKRSGANGLDVFARHAIGENDRKRSRSLASRTALAKETRRSSVPDHSMPDVPPQLSSSPSVDSLNQIQSEHVEQSNHEPVSPKTGRPHPVQAADRGVTEMPLTGIKVVVIHIKDDMKDGDHVKDRILTQLQDYEQRLQQEGQGLGCEFLIAERGQEYMF
ncbi:3',5'-cyclic-nucleotide phosphodiesterase pde1 [Vermiconidia calcicola]|uniref:3',5'-cyclic-nucleotide phosphodiesterase pde1 n=1 Tax=Vermiconidia calcicola TaxID=1690605 RepID=A0ACC3P0A8_9PEZI|nr:3',5'-cyclic-nucleotide phosphodiesterase pde1 [Vermiconidia calcicola]